MNDGFKNSFISSKRLYSFIAIAAVLITLPLIVFLVSQRGPQETRTQASIESIKTESTQLLNTSQNVSSLSIIASSRKEKMKKLAKESPQEFLENTLPSSDREKLPPTAKELVEKEVSIEGQLSEYVAEIPDEKELTMRTLKSGDKIYNINFVNPPDISPTTSVTIQGYQIDDDIVTPGLGTQNEQPVPQLASVTTKKIAVVMVNFKDDKKREYTADQLKKLFFTNSNSVAAFHKDSSFGKVNMTGDVFGWVDVDYTRREACNVYNSRITAAIDAKAKILAASQGLDYDSYGYKFYFYPKKLPMERADSSYSNCYWIAVAPIFGNERAWGNGKWGDDLYNTKSFAHELGHNLGLRHADGLVCRGKTLDAYNKCYVKDYGDNFDSMGNQYRYYPQFSAYNKYRLGYISSANVKTIEKSEGVQKIKIYPSDKQLNETQLVKIKKDNTDDYYFIEYRQRVSNTFDRYLPSDAIRGATIRLGFAPKVEANYYKSYLLDMTPSDTTSYRGFENATLEDGKSYIDTQNNISVKQVGHNSSYVELEIKYTPPPCVRQHPDVTVSPNKREDKPGEKLTYSINVVNKDNQYCEPEKFKLSTENLPASWTAEFESDALSIAHGQSDNTKVKIKSNKNANEGKRIMRILATNKDHDRYIGADSFSYTVALNPTSPTPTRNHTPSPTAPRTPTPTPTTTHPTASPTPTPTAIITPSGSKTYISLVVGLDGIGATKRVPAGGNKNPSKTATEVSIRIFGPNSRPIQNIKGTLVYSPELGKYKGLIDLGGIDTGVYNFYVTSPGYLVERVDSRVKIKEVTPLSEIDLSAGDLNGDDKRNLLDWNLVRACSVFSLLRNQALCPENSIEMKNADLDSNGVVDQRDINLWIQEFIT